MLYHICKIQNIIESLMKMMILTICTRQMKQRLQEVSKVKEKGLNFSIIPSLFKFLMIQNLKLKHQNKIIRFDLYYIFFLQKNIHFLHFHFM
jgi:hypothetical protein